MQVEAVALPLGLMLVLVSGPQISSSSMPGSLLSLVRVTVNRRTRAVAVGNSSMFSFGFTPGRGVVAIGFAATGGTSGRGLDDVTERSNLSSSTGGFLSSAASSSCGGCLSEPRYRHRLTRNSRGSPSLAGGD